MLLLCFVQGGILFVVFIAVLLYFRNEISCHLICNSVAFFTQLTTYHLCQSKWLQRGVRVFAEIYCMPKLNNASLHIAELTADKQLQNGQKI